MVFPKLQSTGDTKNPFNKRLLEGFDIVLSDGQKYRIEKNYVTNLASVPRKIMLRGIVVLFVLSACLAQNGADLLAFVLALPAVILSIGLYNSGRALMDEVAFVTHDWLFDNRKLMRYDRAFVDYQMLYLMKQHSFNPLRPYIMYLGVRAFSWFYWYDVADKLKKG